MKDKDVMILLGVVGVLFMARRSTPTIGHGEQLSATSLELAKHNLDYYNRLTPTQKAYHNISTWWNTSDVNASKTNASKENGTKQELKKKIPTFSTTTVTRECRRDEG